ncbi:glycosyltransferase family protein [Mangrovivirga cuniculi]|uniref:Uncharacterized protein n=1 Tax=Mangrovivirga cuniculi TaxID=2715131 RepID=A0A4D7K6T0_9BACT|nr:glycosyltransferase family 4 protein [Mangrovivirga cuniculi]QCK15098.1 hypothetical protein DCC35_10230 [Mangrovivirga cuniculi]
MNRKILIASTTKPVDDTRMTDKIAATLAEVHKYTIYVIGFPSKFKPVYSNINFFNIPKAEFSFGKRLKALLYILRILIKVKPDIVIASNTETLLVMKVYQIIFGAYLVYDIRENYSLNKKVRNEGSGNHILKLLSVSGKIERSLINKADALILAERIYSEQFDIPSHTPSLLFENKAIIKSESKNVQPPHFLLSGTLSTIHGTVDAVKWFLNSFSDNQVKLTIIGQYHDIAVLNELLSLTNNVENVDLFLSRFPISHWLIQEKLISSTHIISPYHNLTAFEGKLPTKLFEAAANHKIIISRKNASWNSYFKDAWLIETDFQTALEASQKNRILQFNGKEYNTARYLANRNELKDFFTKLDMP